MVGIKPQPLSTGAACWSLQPLKTVHHGDKHAVLPQKVVGLDVEGGALNWVDFNPGCIDCRIIILGSNNAINLKPCHLFSLLGMFERNETPTRTARDRVGCSGTLTFRCQHKTCSWCRISRHPKRRTLNDDRFQLHVDPGSLTCLLDNGLCLLAWAVDRGLEEQLQLLSVLFADAVGPRFPAGLIQQLGCLFDVELQDVLLETNFGSPLKKFAVVRPARRR